MSYYSLITRDCPGEEAKAKDYQLFSHAELLKSLGSTTNKINQDQRTVEDLQRTICRYYARSYVINQELLRRAAKREQLQRDEAEKILKKEQELGGKASESSEKRKRPRSPSTTPPRTPFEVVDVEEVKSAPPSKAKKEKISPEAPISDNKSKDLTEKKSRKPKSDNSGPVETAGTKEEAESLEEDLEKAERDLKKSLEETAPAGEVLKKTPVPQVEKPAPKAVLPLISSAGDGSLKIPPEIAKTLEEGKKIIRAKSGSKSLTIEAFSTLQKFINLQEAQDTTELQLAKTRWPSLF